MVVSLWERGAHKPSAEHVIALAREFGVTANELWSGHDETVPASPEATQ